MQTTAIKCGETFRIAGEEYAVKDGRLNLFFTTKTPMQNTASRWYPTSILMTAKERFGCMNRKYKIFTIFAVENCR
jgi:hypothetical protein